MQVHLICNKINSAVKFYFISLDMFQGFSQKRLHEMLQIFNTAASIKSIWRTIIKWNVSHFISFNKMFRFQMKMQRANACTRIQFCVLELMNILFNVSKIPSNEMPSNM